MSTTLVVIAEFSKGWMWQVLKRKLLARRKFVPWGGAAMPRLSLSPKLPEPEAAPAAPESPQAGYSSDHLLITICNDKHELCPNEALGGRLSKHAQLQALTAGNN